MIKVIVNGTNGRMGQLAVKAIASDPELMLVSEASRQDNLADMIKTTQADIVVDLTNANAVYHNTQTIIATGAHPVVGTSGLTQEQLAELQQHCAAKKLGGIIVPNFSIGAVLMMQFAKQAAHYFPHAEIIERHHENKIDAPSGTAVHTAELIAEVRKNKTLPVATKELFAGARGANLESVPVHSIRLPGYLAQQDVIFGASGETFTLSHNVISRECYMPGLLLACKKVMNLTELIVGLENIL